MENVPFTGKAEQGEERCVLDSRYKLILSTQRPPEMYDLRNDPDEINNRWDEMKSSPPAGQLLAQLRNWAEKTNDSLAPKLIDKVKGVHLKHF
jgi:arylsulfatase A-like enzyme